MKKLLIVSSCITLLTICSYTVYIHHLVVSTAKKQPEQNADYLILLGAKVNGETPSLSLQYRIEAAAKYLKENNHTVAILSGGQGVGEMISEAEAMKRGLLQEGIEEKRIIVEDKSTNTLENIQFSKKFLTNRMKKGVVVTNDFHIYRAISICKKEGLTVTGLSAKTPSIVVPKSYFREYLAVIKYKLLNYI